MLPRRFGVDSAPEQCLNTRTLSAVKLSKTTTRAGLGKTGALILQALVAAHLAIAFVALHNLLADAVRTDPGQVASLVMSLSTMALGAIFAGAVCGHLAVVSSTDSGSARLQRLPRWLPAAVGGAGAGLLAGAAGYLTFSGSPTVAAIVAGVAAASAVLGGLLAAPRHDSVVAAGLIATAILLGFMFLRGWFHSDLAELLLQDGSAYRWISVASGVTAGVAVGLTAYLVLRRRRSPAGLYGYLAAGAAPGVLWVLSEVMVRVGGAALLSTTDEVDELSNLMLSQSLDAQLNGGLATLFTGATTAVLAFGLLAGARPATDTARPSKGKPAAQSTAPPRKAANTQPMSPEAAGDAGQESNPDTGDDAR